MHKHVEFYISNTSVYCNTEVMFISIKIQRKGSFWTTEKKMVQPFTGRRGDGRTGSNV
jgi:hypothetical protein